MNKNISFGRQHSTSFCLNLCSEKLDTDPNVVFFLMPTPVDSELLFKLMFQSNRCLDKVIFLLEAIFFSFNWSSVVMKLDDAWSRNV